MKQTTSLPMTSTRVAWVNIPQYLENGWEVDVYSDNKGEAIMSILGHSELDDEGKAMDLEPKKGGPHIEKPRPDQSQPPMHSK